MPSVFLAHAPADGPFAQELVNFLETGCDSVSFTPDTAIQPGFDLVSTAETGLLADVLVLLLSPASNPSRWVRKRWEPVLFPPASGTAARIAIVLLEECAFPPLLRRGLKFFDASGERLAAMRRMKRWLWGVQSGTTAAMPFSPDLENLYRDLADRPGTCTASGAMAARFAQQAEGDFAAVLWIPAHGRTFARIAGELGSQLELTLDGPLQENCERIRGVLSNRRCLLILDAPEVAVDDILPSGRSSVLFTSEPVRVVEDEWSHAAGRSLVHQGRLAEAYEVFYRLFNSGVEQESCARELVRICEHWDRLEEASGLRAHFRLPPEVQLRLFE
jgi:hypothetical protein